MDVRCGVCSLPLSAGSAVLVTGCSSGIGRATAVRLLRSGWLVFASVRREADGASLRQAVNDHPMLHTLLLDISEEGQVENAAAEVQSVLNQCAARLCAVVCNAGYAGHSLTHSLTHSHTRALRGALSHTHSHTCSKRSSLH